MSSEPKKSTQKIKTQGNKSSKNPSRSGDIFFFIVVFMIIIIAIQFERDTLLDILFNPYTGLILIIMVAEYLFLKSFDRTKVYERENQRYQAQNRQFRKRLIKAKSLLKETAEQNYEESSEEDVKLKTRAGDLAEDIDTILDNQI